MCVCRSVVCSSCPGSIPLKYTPCVDLPRETITCPSTNGETETTCGTLLIRPTICGEFSTEPSYERTISWAFTPRIFFLKSSWNPLITESTTRRVHTPRVTPPSETSVLKEIALCFFLDLRYLSAIKSVYGSFILTGAGAP